MMEAEMLIFLAVLLALVLLASDAGGVCVARRAGGDWYACS
jgi:hypothetical protein